jgi:hypothetical protein
VERLDPAQKHFLFLLDAPGHAKKPVLLTLSDSGALIY